MSVVGFPAGKGPPRSALEAELVHLRRIAARAHHADRLKDLISDAIEEGCLAMSIADRVSAYLMAD